MMYRDRTDAGRHLARLLREQLPGIQGERPVVIATCCSGVPVGRAIADALDAPLDVLVTRRLDAPGCGEVGIGAVACGGTRILDSMTIRMLGVSDAYIDEVTRVESEAAERQMEDVRAAREAVTVQGRTVVLTDDGSATRWRASAAVAALRGLGAARIIVAIPVASSDVRDLLAREADAVVCGVVPERCCDASAVYADLTLPSDEAVRRMLRPAPRRPVASPFRMSGIVPRGDAPAAAP
ncbi:MAG TPA: hypothetical protein VFS05_15295 [Gemmatimonadaceae bacterium]|nr:hypothetical protein [Gemmatimonadaceae bacterium]